jgi:hypothetical protein
MFEKEISFLSKTFDQDEISTDTNGWKEIEVSKTASFHELSRTDRRQHKLHFMMIALFEANAAENGEEAKMTIDSDKLYDLTSKAVKTLLVIDERFTEGDKTEFLNDSLALLNFGMWLLGEHIRPFFSNLMKK